MKPLIVLAAATALIATYADAAELVGPGRFCGYSPIIDLLPGERVTTLSGGIHAGSFRWSGDFGSLEVEGIGWASRPVGKLVTFPTGDRPAKFEQRRVEGGYQVAIWNGGNGAAYFHSPRPFNRKQVQAIDRVALYEEGQEPSGCDLRTIFFWE